MSEELDTEPYSAPDGWADLLRSLAADTVTEPRVVLSQSRGRSAYQTTLDARVKVARLDTGVGERVTLAVPGFSPGDALDLAASLYSSAVRTFLDARRSDNQARVKSARVRLQVFDGDRGLGTAALSVSRDEFSSDDQLFETAPSASDRLVADAMRMVSEHSRDMSRSFVALAKTVGEQAQAERAGLIEYAKGALAIVKEAGEIHSAAVARAAEVEAGGGVWATEGGQLVLMQVGENIGWLGKAMQMWIAKKSGMV